MGAVENVVIQHIEMKAGLRDESTWGELAAGTPINSPTSRAGTVRGIWAVGRAGQSEPKGIATKQVEALNPEIAAVGLRKLFQGAHNADAQGQVSDQPEDRSGLPRLLPG